MLVRVAETGGPLGVELVDRLPRGVPVLQVQLRFGQPGEAGRFEPSQLGDLFPLAGGFVPAVLLLAQLGQRRVVFRFVRRGFDDRRGSPFGLGLVVFQPLGKLLVKARLKRSASMSCNNCRVAAGLSPDAS